MEDRQTQIREGAGLEESKLNVEFIDWLRKWSSPIMGVVLLVVAGFVVNNWIQQNRNKAVDKAFQELDDASSSATPNPDTLKTVASENSGIRAVPSLAELEAADLYLGSARVGLKVGARPKPEDGTYAPEEALTAEQREANLAEAGRLYKKVLDAAGSDPKRAPLALPAAYGIAAVAEARGQLDQAKLAYEQVVKIAEYSGLSGQAEIAKKRIESLPTLAEAPKLLSAADLPKLPEAPKPGEPAATGAVYDPSAAVVAPTGAAGAPAGTGAPEPTGIPAATPPAAPTGPPPAAGEPDPSGAAPEAPKPAEPKPAEPKPAEPKPADPK